MRVRLVIQGEGENGRTVKLPVKGNNDEINAFAQRMAPLYKKQWGTPVTVSFETVPDAPETDEQQDITYNLGSLPTQEG